MMLRHAILLLFLYVVAPGGARPQNDVAEAREDVREGRIKKSELGAKGSGTTFAGNEAVLQNFQNPVLEYLLNKESLRKEDAKRKGVIREIRHGQTLFLPAWNAASAPFGPNPGAGPRDPEAEDVDGSGEGTGESFVMSPTLQLHKNRSADGERRKTQVFPATAIVVTTYNRDGSVKNSVTRYEPASKLGASGAPARPSESDPEFPHRAPSSTSSSGPGFLPDQSINWPLAGYFPIVINDPFLAAYNGITSSVYTTFSSMVEYGPEADICRKKEGTAAKNKKGGKDYDGVRLREDASGSPEGSDDSEDYSNVFDEVVVEAEKLRRGESLSDEGKRRTARDTTAITMDFKNGDRVNVRVEDPRAPNRSSQKGPDLILRKGGLAIAGPGGAATAYTGGTAIVGPYGTVYKSPEGVAIVGPYSRIVNITDDMTFEDILALHRETKGRKGGVPLRKLGSGAKFRNYGNYFSYLTDLAVSIERKDEDRRGRDEEAARRQYADVDEHVARSNETVLIFRPKAKAEAGLKGIALSTPISRALLFPGHGASIKFQPESVATAGPGGFAHAHSDLFLSYLRRKRSAPNLRQSL